MKPHAARALDEAPYEKIRRLGNVKYVIAAFTPFDQFNESVFGDLKLSLIHPNIFLCKAYAAVGIGWIKVSRGYQ
jgi:hypothetical protein